MKELEIENLIKKYEKDLEDAKHDRVRWHLEVAETAADVLQIVIDDLRELIGGKI